MPTIPLIKKWQIARGRHRLSFRDSRFCADATSRIEPRATSIKSLIGGNA
jgi:hypothetical protein